MAEPHTMEQERDLARDVAAFMMYARILLGVDLEECNAAGWVQEMLREHSWLASRLKRLVVENAGGLDEEEVAIWRMSIPDCGVGREERGEW